MRIKVLVTGATGFTGYYVAEKLYDSGYEVYCFVRENSDISRLEHIGVKFIVGDLSDSLSLGKALENKDILVNVSSIGLGYGPDIVKTCQEAQISRAIFFSTTAIFTTLEARSKEVRLRAENSIIHSGLNYTILRPTMIYGSAKDRNIIQLIKFLHKYRMVPVFGDGKSLQQPVYVRDLANAVVQVLDSERTNNKSYNLSGKEPLSFNDLVYAVSQVMGIKTITVHLPVKLSLMLVKISNRIPGLPRITKEQIMRLNENKAFSYIDATNDFGYNPISFREGISLEVEEVRQAGIM